MDGLGASRELKLYSSQLPGEHFIVENNQKAGAKPQIYHPSTQYMFQGKKAQMPRGHG